MRSTIHLKLHEWAILGALSGAVAISLVLTLIERALHLQ